MKSFSFFLPALILALSPLAQANSPATPSDVLFDKVAKQSESLGYFGYDVMACLSAGGRLVAGGLQFWNAALQIYLVDGEGKILPTKRISRNEPGRNDHLFDANGQNVSLMLGEMRGSDRPDVLRYDALLGVGPQEMAQQVACFLRNSGLESVSP